MKVLTSRVGLNERERENRQNTSQCIVPNWNLSPRRPEPVEPEEGNRSSHVHSLQNHHHSLSPHLVSMSEHEIDGLTWENGQLTMHGLGGLPPYPPAKPAWCQPSETLESIVLQATLHKQIPAPNLQGHVGASSATADWKCVPPVGKRPRSDPDQGGRNNVCCSSSMQDVSTCASASAKFCRENDTTLMTWASFESPLSFKTKPTEDDLAWLSRSVKQEEELDAKCETGRSNSTRRSRAAAVHNQSERKRRDKINQKMKALQKLVPNASKIDKASMLDEVIEYLKQLQTQVQLMSMRNSPQMITPFGVQQQLQMSIMARMGMGIGVGIGNMAGTTPQPLTQFVHPTPPTIVPPPFFMQPMIHPQAKMDPAANASAPLPDPFCAYLAQAMNMDLYNKMAGLYSQRANPNPQAGSSPSQSNNVQRN